MSDFGRGDFGDGAYGVTIFHEGAAKGVVTSSLAASPVVKLQHARAYSVTLVSVWRANTVALRNAKGEASKTYSRGYVLQTLVLNTKPARATSITYSEGTAKKAVLVNRGVASSHSQTRLVSVETKIRQCAGIGVAVSGAIGRPVCEWVARATTVERSVAVFAPSLLWEHRFPVPDPVWVYDDTNETRDWLKAEVNGG